MRYSVFNKDREIRFAGELLGEASSAEGSSTLRWTEVLIYRTEGGKYVVEKVGRSDIYHSPPPLGCMHSNGRPYGVPIPTSELDMDDRPCPKCKPDGRTTTVYAEEDRHEAEIVDTARSVIKALQLRDDDDRLFLSSVAERAIRRAAQKDENLYETFLVEEIG